MEKSMLDLVIVHRLSARFSKVAGMYMYALNQNNEIISEITGDPAESKKILNLIGDECLDALYHRVADSELEVQAVEDTLIPNIKIAAVSLHVDGIPVITWMIIGVINDEEYNFPGAVELSDFSFNISFENFLYNVDIMRDVTQLIIGSQFSKYTAEAESRRSKYSEEEMKASLERAETVSSIVQLLDNDAAIEEVMSQCMALIGEYLNISATMVLRTRPDRNTIDICAEWTHEGVVSRTDVLNDGTNYSFVKSDKPLVVSYDSEKAPDIQNDMDHLDITAMVVLPVYLSGDY
ncbi:MAG: hypothetical protein MJ107_06355, partial [Lachnospiraceae bacterium]|nr:hypothetical protein [Lachnospiraceae bacterium]